MKILSVYKCLCDETRLRILNLLQQRPLCVSDLQFILIAEQVKVSKHLHYLKKHGMVTSHREQNRVYYSIAEDVGGELEKNLRCLHDCIQEYPVFLEDLKRMQSKFSQEQESNETLVVEE